MSGMRFCPTVEGPSSPLITHQIGVDTCMARQRTFYHKCHRCQYRGKPATFQLTNPTDAAAAKPAVESEASQEA